jgi:hypothetical protein
VALGDGAVKESQHERVAQTADRARLSAVGPAKADPRPQQFSNLQKRPLFQTPEPINYALFIGFRVGQQARIATPLKIALRSGPDAGSLGH